MRIISKSTNNQKSKRNSTLLDALFPRIRQGVLRVTLSQPGQWWSLSGLALQLRTVPSSLQRELPLLVTAGVLERRRDRNQSFFKARRTSPTYLALRALFEPQSSVAYGSKLSTPHRGLGPLAVSHALMSWHNREKLWREATDKANGFSGKVPGPQAREWGTPLKRGAAVQVMAYLRPKTRILVAEAARNAGRSLSSFLIDASLDKIATAKRRRISPRISASEFPLRHKISSGPGGKSATSTKFGATSKVMVYPRPKIKALFVHAARNACLSLSSFLILASLEKIAADKGCHIGDLIPARELQQYLRRRFTQIP